MAYLSISPGQADCGATVRQLRQVAPLSSVAGPTEREVKL